MNVLLLLGVLVPQQVLIATPRRPGQHRRHE